MEEYVQFELAQKLSLSELYQFFALRGIIGMYAIFFLVCLAVFIRHYFHYRSSGHKNCHHKRALFIAAGICIVLLILHWIINAVFFTMV